MPAPEIGSIIRVDRDDWTDHDNQPGTDTIEGEIIRLYMAPWPLIQLDTDHGRRWIHVRLSALNSAVIEAAP